MGSSFQNKQYAFLDNIELFSSEDETEYFPFHFHDYYCISLITKGTEHLQTFAGNYYATAGTISVTQANEVHKNSSVDTSGYSYKTCYVNPEVLKHYNGREKVVQLQRIIEDRSLFTAFNDLFLYEGAGPEGFQKALKSLALYAKDEEVVTLSSFELIDELAESIPYVPINLDWLCKQFCMSKFHFARMFKNAKGISPQAYIMLKRLKNAKKMLLAGEELKSVSFLTGFYDTAHLNTAFKRFFGITLSMIKNSNNIQDGKGTY
jgi:AraC-like DNA-binding protein